jgi:hypothetical protein
MRLLSEAPGMVDGDGDDLTTEAARIREEEDMTRAKLDVLAWNTSEEEEDDDSLGALTICSQFPSCSIPTPFRECGNRHAVYMPAV